MAEHMVSLEEVVAFVRQRCAVASRFDRDKVADAIVREFTAPPKPTVENDRPIVRVQSPLRAFRERGKHIRARINVKQEDMDKTPPYLAGTMVFVVDQAGDRVLGTVRSCQIRLEPRVHIAVQIEPRWSTATC